MSTLTYQLPDVLAASVKTNLADRNRRTLRVHPGKDLNAGLARLAAAFREALS